MVVLELLFRNLFGFGDQLTRRNVEKHLERFRKKKKHLERLLPPEVERKSWRINLEKFPPLPERRDAEHGFFRLLRTPIWKRCKIDDYYKKQERQLEGYTEVETMIETGYAPGNPAEDEMKPKHERMVILVTNIASIVLFALMVFASIESKSLSIIASILDPFFDLLWRFILWLTSHAMQNPNQHKYPIGMKRLQPVSEPEKDPKKEKWMIEVMTFILLYTMNTWKKTFLENLFALIGRTAPPEILEKLRNLIWDHHDDIKQIGRVRAYTIGSDQYFVEVDIVLSQDMVLSETHDIGETLQVKLEQLPEIERAFVHIDSEHTHRAEHTTMV
ncbi:hypothetical protein RGQ29_018622 [Quercus rubra]|uniref:Cation efflux protein cytoplasmic domain-containing protein n=1 Tax=Quercus rubra TaxID=3512 RepID=A0AAN7J1X3_QUERU|nr:hypothetical protein RGQ29_018622 [Quercus rubra]